MKIAIIGAGLSGLVCAQKLSSLHDVTVFEKSRGVGGRLATRYHDDFEFDHGAPYFTATDPNFKQWLDALVQANAIEPWLARFVEIDSQEVIRDTTWTEDPTHYVGSPRMNTIAKYLAQSLNIHHNCRIESIKQTSDGQWTVYDQHQQADGSFDWVIVAIPYEQSVELFNASGIDYPLLDIEMQPCFALLLGFAALQTLSWDTAFVRNSPINVISVNHSKPKRPSGQSMVMLSSNEWALDNIESERDWVITALLDELRHLIDFDHKHLAHTDLHLWRYANAPKRSGSRAYVDHQQQFALCGDWFIQGRVESAYLSAQQVLLEFEKS